MVIISAIVRCVKISLCVLLVMALRKLCDHNFDVRYLELYAGTAEISHHLGDDKNQPESSSNTRNDYSTKTVATADGPLDAYSSRSRSHF